MVNRQLGTDDPHFKTEPSAVCIHFGYTFAPSGETCIRVLPIQKPILAWAPECQAPNVI